MKLVQAQVIDSVDEYHLIEASPPEPHDGQVRIAVRACGMGYVDALVALGGYQVKPTTPYTPGLEIAGIVDAVGTGVSNVRIGDRIMAAAFGGGLAEYALAEASMVWRIPDALSFAQAASFRTNYVTALHALQDRARLRSGERLLVFGAAGGVGVAAVQLGSFMGAEVIAAASSEAKLSFALSQGAKHGIDVEPGGWRERLKAICAGNGPDVIFDPVCGPLFEPAFRSLAWGGRHLVVGFVGGPIPKLPVNLALMKGASVIGVDVRQFGLFEKDHADTLIRQLLEWTESKGLVPAVGRRFPLVEFRDAMKFALSGKGMGKTVIDMT